MKLWLNIEEANLVDIVDLHMISHLDFDIHIFDFDKYGQFIDLGNAISYVKKLKEEVNNV